jgi:hypothetical protein
MTDNAERRRFTRVPFEASVSVSNPSGRWMGKLKDISLNGVLISLPHGWLKNENKEFLLEIHPSDDVFHIQMEVTVSHEDSHSIGFQCNHIDIDSVSHLRRLVELNIGDESILNRELSSLISSAA